MAFTEETTWFNPLDVPVRMRLLDDGGKFVEVEIAPGAEQRIPSSYDRAIREDREGVILGLGPALVKGGKPAPAPASTPKGK
jgi:hypothetical protein